MEVGRQLDRQGLVLKRGTLIDATLVEAAVARPAGRSGARSALDPDAAWTRRGAKSHFGYKAHLALDQGSGLIRGAAMTPARVNDTEAADGLVQGDEAAVYADKSLS